MSPTHAERAAHVASFYGGDWAAYWRDVAAAKAANNTLKRNGYGGDWAAYWRDVAANNTLGEERDRAERARKAESERG